MRSAYGTTISAPSAALLRFLRCQSQEICFFNSGPGLNFSHDSSEIGLTRSYRKGGDGIRSLSKNIDTYRRRHATCEASILNFDFSSHGAVRSACRSSTFCAESQRSILKRSIRYDRANQIRQASGLFRPLFERMWGSRRRNGQASLKPDDPTGRPSFLEDVSGAILGRSKVGKASNEMKLRCTELNENGTVTLVNGEFKKSELIAKVSARAATPCMGTRS